MTRLGLGLIGAGKHGVRYAHHICNDFPELRLVALARRDLKLASEQAATYDCRSYADFRDLIVAPDVDAIVVVTPPTLHPAIIDAAAQAGKPVLLEKPAAASLSDARYISERAAAANIPVMVAQTLRFNGVVRALLAARERIAPIHGMRIGQRFEPSRPGWIDDVKIAGGGMILHTGVHCFDLVRILSGREVTRVGAARTNVGTVRTEDNFAVLLQLDAPEILASVGGSRATASRSGAIEMAGGGGQLIADHVLNYAYEVHGTTMTPLDLPPPVATVREVVAAFAGALRSGSAMPIPFTEGMRAVAIAEACYRSSASGRLEDVEAV